MAERLPRVTVDDVRPDERRSAPLVDPEFLGRLPTAVIQTDADGTLLWANDTALSMYVDNAHQPGDRIPLDRLQEVLRLPPRPGDLPDATAEVRIATDPALVTREAVVEHLADGTVVMAFTPTEDHRTRAAGEAEARLATMLEHTHDIITVLGADGTIKYSNPAAGLLTGIRGSEANGGSALDFVHPDDLDTAATAMARALEGTFEGSVELRLRFADGTWHPAEVFLDNLLDHPAVEGLVVTVRDITDQRAHAEALVRSERRLRSLVENLSDVIVVLDANLTVAYASPGIETFIPAPAYTNLGESAFNDIHPDDVGRVAAEVGELMQQPGGTIRMEMRLGADQDRWRWVEVTAVNRLDDPSVSGLVCTLRDISARRAKGDELRQAYDREREAAMKLRELDRLKDEFLATVSHELRTPLTSISGFSQVLLRDTSLTDQQRSLLERVSRSARDMTSMIENLLDFSRLQAGQVAIDLQPVDLADAVSEIIDDLSHHLAQHTVEVDVASYVVRADRAGLAHILRNLLVNAAKYSKPGTTIRVTSQADDDEAIVDVADQGIGIEPQHQGSVFRHFFQADPGRTGRRGAGVGLNIARRYAQLQGGRLSFESAPGKGSTFHVALPRWTDDAEQ